MNTIRIQLAEGASAETIMRAHAAINAFTGKVMNLAADGYLHGISEHRPIDAVAGEQAGPVTLDSDGLPWHADIHASTKTLTQKGAWTKRKGVDEATINRVTAELRALFPAPVANITATTSTIGTVNTGVSVPKIGAINIAPKTEYQKLVDFIATNVASGKIDQPTIDATFANNSTSLAALAGDEASSTAFREAFEGYVASQA